MKKLLPLLVILALPTSLFAQAQQKPDARLLGRLGLNDAQISQVMDIQKKTSMTVRQDRVHIRLLRAQLAEALLPSSVDMQAVNNLISQQSQARADIQKALVGAQVQLRQVMGDDAFRLYARHLMAAMHRRHFHRWGRWDGSRGTPWTGGPGTADGPQQ